MCVQARAGGINEERQAGVKPILGYGICSPACLGEDVDGDPKSLLVNYLCEIPKLWVRTTVQNKVFSYHRTAGANVKRKLAPDYNMTPI